MDLTVTNLFCTWAAQRGMEGITLDPEGMAAFEIDQGIVINFQAHASSPMLTLFAIVAALPTLAAEERCLMLEDMLAANLLWRATAGATLALQHLPDVPGMQVVVARNMPIHGTSMVSELDRIFDNLCLVSLDWKTRIENRLALSERGQYRSATPEQLISMHP